MKHGPVLGLGLVCIVIALYLALGTTNQDNASRPADAIAFATALHRTPPPTPTDTPSPTPTQTPVPTVTRVAGWLKLHNLEAEIWIPYNYSGGGLDSTIVLYAYDAASDLSKAFPTILVVRMNRVVDAESVQETFDHLNPGFRVVDKPEQVSVTRYRAWTTTVEGYAYGDVRIRRLLYLIPRQGDSWLLIFAAPINRFDSELPAFQRIADSFSVLF